MPLGTRPDLRKDEIAINLQGFRIFDKILFKYVDGFY